MTKLKGKNKKMSLFDKAGFIPVLAGAVQNSPVSIIITDALGNFLYVNPKFTELTGFSPEEILGKNARIRRTDKTDPDTLESLSRAIHDGMPWRGELWNRKKSGELYLESVLISPIKDQDNQLTHFVGMQLDITRERQLLQKVIASETAFRLLANSITDVYFALDENLQITYWNGACEKISGLSSATVLGQSIESLTKEKIGISLGSELFTALKEQKEQSSYKEITISGKSYFWEINYYPTGSGVVVLAKDITERHQLTLELNAKNAELKTLLELKDKFFSIVAHDLRSPFQSMLGLSSLLAEESQSMPHEEIGEISIRLRNTIRNTFSLLQNLLEWSRLEIGRIPVALVKQNVKDAIVHSIGALELAAQQKEISVTVSVEDSLMIAADQYMIVSILHNMLSNAIKFTPRGGNIHYAASRNGGIISVDISDTGMGMSAETAASIFELGAGSTTLGTDGEKGTGLGLILCKEMMLRQNGSIHVNSSPGNGTTFTLIFNSWDE